ncbi:hypothetical protein [Paraglaciecola marina]|uniref:hypothetical protein n=1 Tax=Paraglaciecola marina TaxID=2500157 RepID=UPI00105CFCCB|nr:hypothetical protein [Paraglaciecola marina]
MEPDYSQYSLGELFEVHGSIDSKKYPKRFAKIEECILLKKCEPSQYVKTLLNIEDSYVSVAVDKTDDDNFEFKIAITYNFINSYEETCYTFDLTSKELKYLIKCLTNGIESKHGKTSIWQANQITVKKQITPLKSCKIRIYTRVFILGFSLVPVSISGKIIAALNKVEI